MPWGVAVALRYGGVDAAKEVLADGKGGVPVGYPVEVLGGDATVTGAAEKPKVLDGVTIAVEVVDLLPRLTTQGAAVMISGDDGSPDRRREPPGLLDVAASEDVRDLDADRVVDIRR